MDNQDDRVVELTVGELKALVKEAADQAAVETIELVKTSFVNAVGETVIQKAGYLIGVGFVAAWWYLEGKGLVK